MIERIYRDANLLKQLKAMRRSGGQGLAAADQAEAIVERVVTGGKGSLAEAGRLTRSGEARFKNCVKYDLAGGFRLIAFKDGNDLVFAFVGTHDEGERWIRHNQNNSGIRPIIEKRRNETTTACEAEASPPASPPEPEAEFPDEYDDRLAALLDDRMLRKIFRGLCRK